MSSPAAPATTSARPRVLIVSENISMKSGGETAMGYFYAKLFRARGVEVWLACHERVGAELKAGFPDDLDRIYLASDTPLQKTLYRISQFFPARLREMIFDQLIHYRTQMRLRKHAIDLGRRGLIDVVLEPAPITPRGLSFMYDLGVPVAIGPLCGGLDFPPAFRHLDSRLTRATFMFTRSLSNLANRLVPGKRKADVLMVANRQTASALPSGCRGRVITVIESAVDLSLWGAPQDGPAPASDGDERPRFVFSGRFADWKGIGYLVRAFELVLQKRPDCVLDLIGAGDMFEEIKGTVEGSPALRSAVNLHGWISRPEAMNIIRRADVFVMPSIRECGGAAMLEAMALGKPVVATNWAGPGIYVNDSCGIPVDPGSEEGFVRGLADAMLRLADSPELRERLSRGALARVHEMYLDWDGKADRVLEILTALVEKRPIPEGQPVDV
ncbi:glycosyltransferase family 4 protein [Paludisphaera mucosa]|uniref:Glycosyltransferase family 4 protein n=1 Tax=Paludisphaera mucosa TaxID=3030827 RepID=A0ABT6F9P2_9BACT|nr:glycosyltransferase family 4 protein [Paludisphaera mucosa]MDG3004196.1 glycosyltransferase family 4 protein [Paludisphaera mucosa]